MTWKPEAEELKQRHAYAEALGGAESVTRHHAQNRLTVRERIAGLVDSGSFQEVGKLTGSGTYKDGKLVGVTPAPYVMGLGSDRRPPGRRSAARISRCAAARAGRATARKAARAASSRTCAASYRIPLVNLIDGAGGSVTSHQPARPCGVSRRARLRALGGAAGRRCRWSARCWARPPAVRPGARSFRTGR